MEGVELARMMADHLQQVISKREADTGDFPCLVCGNELVANKLTNLWEDEFTGDLCVGRDGQNHTLHKPLPTQLKSKEYGDS